MRSSLAHQARCLPTQDGVTPLPSPSIPFPSPTVRITLPLRQATACGPPTQVCCCQPVLPHSNIQSTRSVSQQHYDTPFCLRLLSQHCRLFSRRLHTLPSWLIQAHLHPKACAPPPPDLPPWHSSSIHHLGHQPSRMHLRPCSQPPVTTAATQPLTGPLAPRSRGWGWGTPQPRPPASRAACTARVRTGGALGVTGVRE